MTSPYKGADAHIKVSTYYPHDFVVANTVLMGSGSFNFLYPIIVLILGAGRSGTTGLLAWLMSNVGVQLGYYQPFKTIIRHGLQFGQLCIPGKACGVEIIVMKDTFGPFKNEFEEFDAVQMLLAAGIPASNIILVPIMRNPLATYKSNFKFEGGIEAGLLISNLKFTVALLNRYAKILKVIPLAYDLFGLGEEMVAQAICQALGLKYYGLDLDKASLQIARLDLDYHYVPGFGKLVPGEIAIPAERVEIWDDMVTRAGGRFGYQKNGVVTPASFSDQTRRVGAELIQQECSALYVEFYQLSAATLGIKIPG